MPLRRNPWLYGEGLTCCTARASTPELSDKGILELFEKSPQKKLNSSYKPEPRPAERVKVGPDGGALPLHETSGEVADELHPEA